jgi:hypothetical protein
MCTGLDIAIRTGRPGADQGGSWTFPRLESIDVSHTSEPNPRSAIRTASLFSTTGHHPGASPIGPAEARCRPACLMTLV